MKTQNWINIAKLYFASIGNVSSNPNFRLSVVDTSGTTRSFYDQYIPSQYPTACEALCYSTQRQSNNIVSPSGGVSVVFGSGTTAPTINDYRIESSVESSISKVQSAYQQINGTNYTESIHTIMVTNTSANSITISEVATYYQFYQASSSITKTMLERWLLDTPATIASGDTKAIKVHFKFDYSTLLSSAS